MRDGETSDAAWAVMEPLLPPVGRARGRWRDHRQVLEGIVFQFRTGLPWRDVPERFGPWRTAHGRFARWAAEGTFDRLLAAAESQAEVDWAGRGRFHDRAGSSAHGCQGGSKNVGSDAPAAD
ncbi:transposase [Streptomyces gardneri]|uniref:transposase n=1 Tax=Streptomyces gardneri TaxID=66892 RepID=UPI0036CE648A